MKSIVLRPPMRPLIAALILALCSSLGRPVFGQESKWTEEQANKWYSQQPWLVGANFLPSDAINELEMWQAETFDPKEIDREFGWAQAIGMNTMRVFLHNLLWDQDSAGFQRRIDQFLSIPPHTTSDPSSCSSTHAGTRIQNSVPSILQFPAYTIPVGFRRPAEQS